MFNVNELIKDRKVKISEKQCGRLKNFYNKDIMEKDYIPQAKFIHELENIIKRIDNLSEQIEKQNFENKETSNDLIYNEIVKKIDNLSLEIDDLIALSKDEKVPAKKIFNDALNIKNKISELSKEIDDSNLTNDENKRLHSKLEGLKDFDSVYKAALKIMVSPKKKEDEVATSTITNVETQTDAFPEIIEKDSEEKVEEKPIKKEKKALDDLTVFMTYTDYKKAYFYNYYLAKQEQFSLDEVAEILASDKKLRTLLSEVEFQEKRDSQIYAKEIAEVKRLNNETIDNLNKEHALDKKKFQDSIQHELDNRQAKLDDARSKNRIINSKLRVYDVLTKNIKSISLEMNGIGKIDDEIKKADEKIAGIDERALARETEKSNNDVLGQDFESQQPTLSQDSAESEVKEITEEKPLDQVIFADNGGSGLTDESKNQNPIQEKESTLEKSKEDEGQELLSELSAPKVVEPIKTEMPTLQHEWKNGSPIIFSEMPTTSTDLEKVKVR